MSQRDAVNLSLKTVGTTRGRVEEADPEVVEAEDEGADHEEALRNAEDTTVVVGLEGALQPGVVEETHLTE